MTGTINPTAGSRKVRIRGDILPQTTGCSFCWSAAAILQTIGHKAAGYDLAGFSVNAFSIWAHPGVPVKLWGEANCDMFTTLLLASLGLKGQLLSAERNQSDLLEHFLSHWSGILEANLRAGIGVGGSRTWTQSAWGVITDWDKEKRFLKGYIPTRKKKVTNNSWPDKLLVITGHTPPLPIIKSMRLVLEEIETLGDNRMGVNGWVSGLDAYNLWLECARQTYTRKQVIHKNLAYRLSRARKLGARFLSAHADLHQVETERMMLALGRRYNRTANQLLRTANAPGKRPFITSLTEAMGEEEKALILTEEILFHIQ